MTILYIAVAIVAVAATVFLLRKNAANKPLPPFEGEVKPEEIVVMGEGSEANGLCMIFGNMFTQTLKNKPYKFDKVRGMNTSISIEDIKTNTAAVTMVFKDDRITLLGGVVGKPKIYIGTDPQTLMSLSSMEKKEILKKVLSRELKLRGLIANFDDFKKFSSLMG